MITRPTTDVLIEDCCRELMEGILPGLTDDDEHLEEIATACKEAGVRARVIGVAGGDRVTRPDENRMAARNCRWSLHRSVANSQHAWRDER